MLNYDSQERRSLLSRFARKPLDRILLYVALALAIPTALFILLIVFRLDWFYSYYRPIERMCFIGSLSGAAAAMISFVLKPSRDGVICMLFNGLLAFATMPRAY